MISKIKVVSDIYNIDSKRPTSEWTVKRKKASDNPNINFGQFSLPEGTLPVNHELKLPPSSSVYFVVGSNNSGKSTFLRGLVDALHHTQEFNEFNRTAMFDGRMGLGAYKKIVEPGTGGFNHFFPEKRHDNQHPSGNKWSFLYSHSGDPWATSKKDKEYALAAVTFYLQRAELFDNPFFEHYENIPDDHLDERLHLHFASHWYGEKIWSQFSEVFELPEKSLGDSPDVKRKFAYLVENAELLTGQDTPLNRFWNYQLTSRKSFKNYSIHIFDIHFRTDKKQGSEGGYTRRVLEDQLQAVSDDPKKYHIILLEEPTAHFDTTNAEWFENTYLPTIKKQNNAVAFIETHDRSVLKRGKERDIDALVIDLYEKPVIVRSQ